MAALSPVHQSLVALAVAVCDATDHLSDPRAVREHACRALPWLERGLVEDVLITALGKITGAELDDAALNAEWGEHRLLTAICQITPVVRSLAGQ